jgi:hypothetical protein
MGLSTEVVHEDYRQGRRREVSAAIEQACRLDPVADFDQRQSFVASFVATPAQFDAALPTLLTCLAKGDEETRRFAATIVAMRPHWISPSYLDDLVVPALVAAVSKMEDQSAADQLLTAVLLTAPRLGQQSVDALTRLVDVDVHQPLGERQARLVALSLLGPRVPYASVIPVVWAIQSALNKHREALKVGMIPQQLQEANARSLLRLALVGLFAQRNLGALPSNNVHLWRCRCILIDESRRAFFALEEAVKDERLPQWQEYYQMLVTTFIVDQIVNQPNISALLRMLGKLNEDAPVLAHTLSKLLWQRGFKRYLLNVREQFDPERLDAGVLFAAAVMATTIDVEQGVKGLSEAEAAVCYGDLNVLLTSIKDPYLAYCVIEFQRVLAEHFPVLRT